MSNKKRLAKITTSLTPKQSVLLWLKEAREFGFYEYVEWVAHNFSSDDSPQHQIYKRIEKSVREAMKYQDKNVIDRAVSQACREAAFLFTLVLNVNVGLLNDSKANTLQAALLAEQLKGVLLNNERTSLLSWRMRVIAYTGELLRIQTAIEIISDKFFEGHQILCRNAAENLTSNIETINQIIDVYNETSAQFLHGANTEKLKKDNSNLPRTAGDSFTIDLEEIHQVNQSYVADKVGLLVNSSKAEIMVDQKRQAALDLLMPYIMGESSE